MMINGGPVELRLQIAFHLLHQVSNEGFDVRELIAIVRRYDDPELMSVAITPLGEVTPINFI
jgi:hypothetical protein